MKSLAGKRIVITRAPHQAAAFAQQLTDLGAVPIVLPLIAIEPILDSTALDAALQQIYDWAIFTSSNTVEQIWVRLAALGLSGLAVDQVAAVGTRSAAALQERGIFPQLIPSQQAAVGLYVALSAHHDLKGQTIFLPQSDLAPSTLGDNLQSSGAQVTSVVAYRTVRPPLDPTLLAQPFDAITFTSPSTVQHFTEMLDNPLAALGLAKVICMGSVTAQAAQTAGLPVHAIANAPSVAGLVAAMCDLL